MINLLSLLNSKCDADRAAAEGLFEAIGVGDVADARVAVGGGEGLVEEHDAVVPIEHDVAGVDGSDAGAVGGQRLAEVVVFLVAVQVAHLERQGQQGSEGLGGAVLLQRGAEGSVAYGDGDIAQLSSGGRDGFVIRCTSHCKKHHYRS